MRPDCLLGQSADGREFSSLGESVPTEVTLHTLGYLTLVPGFICTADEGAFYTAGGVLGTALGGCRAWISTCCFT